MNALSSIVNGKLSPRSAGPLSDRSPGRFPSRLDGWSGCNRRVPAENFEHPRLVNLPPRERRRPHHAITFFPCVTPESGRHAGRKFWRLKTNRDALPSLLSRIIPIIFIFMTGCNG